MKKRRLHGGSEIPEFSVVRHLQVSLRMDAAVGCDSMKKANEWGATLSEIGAAAHSLVLETE